MIPIATDSKGKIISPENRVTVGKLEVVLTLKWKFKLYLFIYLLFICEGLYVTELKYIFCV